MLKMFSVAVHPQIPATEQDQETEKPSSSQQARMLQLVIINCLQSGLRYSAKATRIQLMKPKQQKTNVFYKFLLLNPTCFAESPSERSETRTGEAGHLIHAFSSIQTWLGFTFVYV